MTKSVWKFPLSIVDEQEVSMPSGSWLLTVQLQHGKPCLWARVDTDNPIRKRVIVIHGTGHAFDHVHAYFATFQMADGDLVFHAFDGGERP